MSDFKEGQELVYVPSEKRGSGLDTITVTKVGRKWVSFKTGRGGSNRFDKDTMLVDGGGYASPGKIYPSMAAYQDELDTEEALRELRQALQWPGSAEWRARRKDVTAQRVRLAMGLLLIGGDTDPLEAMRTSYDCMLAVAQGNGGPNDLAPGLALMERLGIGSKP